MKRPLLYAWIALCTLFTAAPLSAQDWAKATLDKSPRHREWVAIPHAGRTLQTVIVYPETRRKAPVLLMIHEIFGLTDWVQDMADQLAAAGYIVVVPDLLSGSAPKGGGSSSFDQDGAIKAVSQLDKGQVTADLNAAADFGLKLPSSDGHLFVIGFCWGGGQSFRFATNRADLSAAFVFYGPPPENDSLHRIRIPVYGFYAGNDARIDATIPATTDAMRVAGKTYQPVIYDGAGHGFMRAGEAPDASPENKKARTEALARLKQLLQQNAR